MYIRATAFCLTLPLFLCISAPAQAPIGTTKPQQVSKADREKRNLPLDADITGPQVVFAQEPNFPENARKHKGAWTILVHLQIDTDGSVHNVQIVRGVGFGYDESAVVAVCQYRFKPAMQDGMPIPWDLNVEVNFQVF